MVVSLFDHAEEHYLSIPRGSDKEFGASYYSYDFGSLSLLDAVDTGIAA